MKWKITGKWWHHAVEVYVSLNDHDRSTLINRIWSTSYWNVLRDTTGRMKRLLYSNFIPHLRNYNKCKKMFCGVFN